MRRRLTHADRADSGSTLVEVCVAMAVLWSLGFISAAAQTQALARLTAAMEYRKAVWMAAGAAESLRAGDSSGGVALEWSAKAARVLDDGRVSIRSVPGHAMVIEVGWVSRRPVHAATCAHGNACVAIVVGVFHSIAR